MVKKTSKLQSLRNLVPILKMIFKAILKYKNNPNIIAIKEKPKNSRFKFHEVDN